MSSVSWFNEGNLFLQPYKNLQCSQDFKIFTFMVTSPCSSVFPFCLTLMAESQAHPLGTIFKNYSQFKKRTCLSGLPDLTFSELRKVFTYIIFFYEYMAENTGVAFSLITRLLLKAMALTKSTRKRNKNNFRNGCLKQN